MSTEQINLLNAELSNNTNSIVDDQETKQNQEEDQEQTNQRIIEYYKNAEHVSIIPLLKLIYNSIGLDLSNKFKLKYSITSERGSRLRAGEIILSKGNLKKYKIYLDIVDRDYDLLTSLNKVQVTDTEITSINNLDDNIKTPIISAISFLTQACLIIFNKLKDEITSDTSNNVYKNLLDHTLTLDNNTTVYMIKETNKRIGIVFE
jgi:hypothetical protein